MYLRKSLDITPNLTNFYRIFLYNNNVICFKKSSKIAMIFLKKLLTNLWDMVLYDRNLFLKANK